MRIIADGDAASAHLSTEVLRRLIQVHLDALHLQFERLGTPAPAGEKPAG